ncbi:unnamed protein product [Closterium sp. NIES-53]
MGTTPGHREKLQCVEDFRRDFRGDRHFASVADEADWDEQNVDNASDEAGPLPYCSVPIPMDDENPRESVNAETYFDLADTGYVTPAAVNTNEAESVGHNFIPDPEEGDEAAYPEDATLPRYTQSGLQILGLVTASLYGIKQALRLWQQYLHTRLTRIGFKQLPHDQGMYRLSKSDDYILLIVYVDDLLYIGSNDDITTWFEGELQQDLTLTVSSTVTQYLGLNIREEEGAIYINAAKYTDTIAKRFAITPTAISTPYRYATGKDGSVLLKPAGIRNYQKKLGCLLFAAVTCRPDLSYSASQLATYLKRPETEHLAELDRALHYFVSTPMIGLTYYKNATTPTELVDYVDTDHAGDADNRRSRTGYIYRLEPIGPISWQSSK